MVLYSNKMNDSVCLEYSPCPLGCPENDKLVLIGQDLLHNLPGQFTVVKCLTCGLMRTNPRPTRETIGHFYPDDYGPYLGTQIQKSLPKRTPRIRKIIRHLLKTFFKFNTEPLPQLFPGRLLEVGCASGAFLHRMALQGWEVEGIEFSEKAADEAKKLGYRVYTGSLENAPKPNQPFDLIVGWMVLEHLHDPIGSLIKLREWAKPDSWLALSMPNTASHEFKMFKEKWYALQLPTHVFHFTPETLNRVLSASGWTLVKTYHHRVLGNLLASIGYKLADSGYKIIGQKLIDFPEKAAKMNFVLYPFAYLLSLFGQTGRMTIWARKSS